MRICVTGGLGFIGSHIVDALLDKGHEVFIVDDLSTGSLDNYNDKAGLCTIDICNADALEKFFSAVRPEAVCHQAAQVSVGNSMRSPAGDARTNIIGTLNILDMCREYKCRRVVFSSSAAVYGDPQYLPVDEDHPKQPLSFYGLSKLTAEHYIRLYGENSFLTYAILRYANVYGPRQKAEGEGGVVSVFAEGMNANGVCGIEGDGEQTRDFIYVKDIARLNCLALTHSGSFTANAGTGTGVAIRSLFCRMAALKGYRKEALEKPRREGDIRHSSLDSRLAREILDWSPGYGLDEGLKDMLI
ncbi:MAG: NAD-dependent epimerase/dehydratase family protein [Clostridia bacterium]